MPTKKKQSSEAAVREIRRRARRRFSAEEKIRIVLEGLRGEESIAALCRREGIAANLYYRWSKEFLEAGKKRLNGDTVREATSNEVKVLRSENRELKEVVAEMTLKNRVLKKSLTGHGDGGRFVRRSGAEKMEMIRLVEQSDLSVRSTLRQLGIAPSTFYGWYQRYLDGGPEALEDRRPPPRARWNKISQEIRQQVVDLALERTELSPRELACHFTDERRYFLSESSVYRILKAYDLITSPAFVLLSASDCFSQPTRRVNEMWQTDFTYLRVIGWGWYYLSTVMDDYSRYIVSWKLRPTMSASDVMETLDEAVALTGVDSVQVRHRPRLLSDNGPAYVSKDLREYLAERGMTHTRGRPYHPQTQGKIERYHRSMKNVVKLEHYHFPWQLEAAVREFVTYYNNERYHESLENVTPSDVYYGRHQEVLSERSKIKQRTMQQRKKEYRAAKAA